MKSWYALKDSADTATLSVYDEIGAYGVSAKNFLNDLKAVQAKSVSLEINSPGGDVFAGIAIYNGLRASGKTINVKVMGIAASAASLIAMAGDTIEMPENSMMMIHNPWSFAVGDAEEMRATADVLDKIGNSLVATYAKRTGRSDDEITAMLNAETWLTAQEALDMGFATSVTETVAARASFDLSRLPDAVKAVWAKAAAAGTPDEDQTPDEDDSSATDEDAVVFEDTLADQITAVAKAAGLEMYAAAWVADASIANKEAAVVRATLAREVKSICAHAGHPDLADALIKANASMTEARDKVLSALGAADEIDTAPRAFSKPVPGAAQPTALSGSDIWAARQAKTAK